MALTPLDIHNKEFRRTFRGYSEQEVDEFLDEVVREFELLLKENASLKDQIAELEGRVEQFRTMEESLHKALVVAQQAAEDVRTAAKKEAELIVAAAGQEAERIQEHARSRIRETTQQYNDLKQEMHLFRTRMKTLIQSQLELLDEAIGRSEHAAAVEAGPGVAGEPVSGE